MHIQFSGLLKEEVKRMEQFRERQKEQRKKVPLQSIFVFHFLIYIQRKSKKGALCQWFSDDSEVFVFNIIF